MLEKYTLLLRVYSRRLDIFLSIAADLPFLTYLRPCQLQPKRMLGRVCGHESTVVHLLPVTHASHHGFSPSSHLLRRIVSPNTQFSPLKSNNNNNNNNNFYIHSSLDRTIEKSDNTWRAVKSNRFTISRLFGSGCWSKEKLVSTQPTGGLTGAAGFSQVGHKWIVRGARGRGTKVSRRA